MTLMTAMRGPASRFSLIELDAARGAIGAHKLAIRRTVAGGMSRAVLAQLGPYNERLDEIDLEERSRRGRRED